MYGNYEKNKKRIFTILSILKKRDEGYRDLHDKLCKHYNQDISYSTFTKYTAKLKEKRWIYDKNPNRRRGMSSILSINDLGLDCYKYKVGIRDYDDYEKSFYLLFFFMGIGVSYDASKLNDGEIRNIQLRNDYYSISKNDSKRDILKNDYRLFGYIDFKQYSDDNIDSILKFLIDKEILRYDVDKDRYYLKNPKFQDFLNKFWSILYQCTFRILFEYVYTYIRKPLKTENDWLETLFGKKAIYSYELSYNTMRSQRKKSLKNKGVCLSEIKPIKGENLIANLTFILNRLNTYIYWLKKEYLESNFDNEHQFYINRILKILHPEFIQKDDFIKNLNIKSNKNY